MPKPKKNLPAKDQVYIKSPTSGRLVRRFPKAVESEQQMIDAIRQARGVVTVACKILGIDYTTWFRYIHGLPNLQKAYKEANEQTLDLAENRLFQFIEGHIEGATPALTLDAIKFLLINKGKSRGYGQSPMVQIEKGVVLKANYPAIPPPSDDESETALLDSGFADSDSEGLDDSDAEPDQLDADDLDADDLDADDLDADDLDLDDSGSDDPDQSFQNDPE